MPRYLITGDPAHTMQAYMDSTLRMAQALLARGIAVDYCDLFETDLQSSPQVYLQKIPVREILSVQPSEKVFISLAEKSFRDVRDYDVLLHRKDPPVDDFFKTVMKKFGQAPKNILQINDPLTQIQYSEKELATFYPEFAIPTQICSNFAEFEAAIREKSPEAVAKPFNECSGIGVEFFKPDVERAELERYWRERQPLVIVQPYLDEITRSGDLRVFVVNTRVVGAVLRVPKKGSRLGNLHQGASAARFDPTPRQLLAAKVISESLTGKGLYILGLDFIGDQLSEINMTSPTGLAQINAVTGVESEKLVIDEIEKLRLNGNL